MPNQQMKFSSISNPEFINLQPLDVNPLMSSCEIKVLYVGKNRNRSYISKETAAEMAKTLRGAPIVGYYREDKDDFRDHGDQVILDGDGINFNCLTKPYGFVSPDAKVWFQKFEEKDSFGNAIEREYLMTTGYLWTGQFEESKLAVEEGRPQSMELDGDSLKGSWEIDTESNVEYFIINDATFYKLCILGQDVEPCFEGASVSAPDVSKNFALDESFTKTLYSMMQDLNFALKGEKDKMEDEKKLTAGQDKNDKSDTGKFQDNTEGVATVQEETPAADEEFEKLQAQYTELMAEYQKLKDYQNQMESIKKDEVIAKFYMLSDEDKKDVIENKDKYTVEEIQSKLSVIYTNKQFALEQQKATDAAANKPANVITYTVNDSEGSKSVPDWVKAVRETEKTMNV